MTGGPASRSSQFPPSSHGFMRHQRVQWLLVALILTALGAAVMLVLAYERERTLQREGELMMLQARVIDENLGQQLKGMDAVLSRVRAHMMGLTPGEPNACSAQGLQALSEAMPGVQSMIVTDADGVIVASDRPEFVGYDVSRRPYFHAARADPSAEHLHVSAPFETLLKAYTINVTKSWVDGQGRFAGLVSATLDQEYFRVLLHAVLYAPDMRSVITHGGGLVLLSAPASSPAPGTNLRTSGSFFMRHMAGRQRMSLMSGTTVFSGEERMAVYRTVQPEALGMSHPLVLSVSRTRSAMLAPWRKLAWLYGLSYLALVLVVCVSTFLLQRNHQVLVRLALLRERESREYAEKIDLALAGADLGLWELDLGTGRRKANARAQRMVGLAPQDAAEDMAAWSERIHPDDRAEFEGTASLLEQNPQATFALDYRVRHQNGQWIWIHSRGQPTRWDADGKPQQLTGTYLDITQRKQDETRIAELAFHDPLTHLPNRRLLQDRLEQVQRLSARSGTYAALLFLDLDRFKWVNDTFGHDAGDQLLRQVAERLRACVRRSDTVGRLGGDEFVLLVHPLGDSAPQAHANVQVIVNAVLAMLRQPVALSSTRHTVTTSIGVALFRGTDEAPEQILRRADQAMYRAKAVGRNQAHIDATPGAAV